MVNDLNPGSEDLIANGGKSGTNVPAGAGTVAIKSGKGRLCRVTVLVAGTGAGSVLFYDAPNATNFSAAGAQPVAAIAATIGVPTTAGALVFDLPFFSGLVVVNVVNGPQLYVSYN